jgi:hypothetical protein
MAETKPLKASRNRDFAETLLITYYGAPLPLTGATIKMEVRQYQGAAGSALASDTDVDFLDAADATEDRPDRRLLTLLPNIAKSALAALPGQNTPDAGDPQTFQQEVMIIYADTARDSLWIGDFIVYPGVVA